MLIKCNQWAAQTAQPPPRDMAACIRLVGTHFDRRLVDAEFQRKLQGLKATLQPLVSRLVDRALCLNQYGVCPACHASCFLPAAGLLLFIVQLQGLKAALQPLVGCLACCMLCIHSSGAAFVKHVCCTFLAAAHPFSTAMSGLSKLHFLLPFFMCLSLLHLG